MKQCCSVFLFLFICISVSFAKKELMYPVEAISAQLLKGADAVVRESHTVLDVISESKITYTEKYVVTVLKESGADKALLELGYDKLSSVSHISAIIYNAQGKKIKSIPVSEIGDFTAISGFSLYEDNRVKKIDPKQNVYPFTVEYKWVKKYNSAYFIRGWYAFHHYNTSVENLSFKIKTPIGYKYHYEEHNVVNKPIEKVSDGYKELTWEHKNFIAPQKEILSAHFKYWSPCVNIAPNQFVLDGYKGSLESWKSFGKFCADLNKGRGEIPQETIDKVKALLTNDMTDYEKISKIYEYSQKKNRYVSIQEGIGGQQPFDAETVDRLSYGDCKALSNYVASLLKTFGFNAYYTLVHAGNSRITKKDFVRDYFNHIITGVPVENDTIWLECTNSFAPCGYLGDFTDDRYVLMVKEEGGELVRTPGFSIDENKQQTVGKFTVSADGSATGSSVITYSGAFYGNKYGLVLLDESDRRKKVIKSINIPHFELLDYNLRAHKERKPWLDKELSVAIPGYASKLSNRLFFSLNVLNKSSSIPPYSRNRQSPMLINHSVYEKDSIIYALPNEYAVEALPDPVDLKSEFGAYKYDVLLDGEKIIYKRSLKIRKGQYPKEKYNEFVEFLEKVAKYDEAKVVLLKNT